MEFSLLFVHVSSVLFFGSLAFTMFSPWSLFPYHPFFMMIGYGVLMGEAILFSRNIKSRARKYWLRVHLILQLMGFILVTLGFGVIVYNKLARDKMHFQSWHARLGLCAYLFTTGQVLFGLLIYYVRKWIIKRTSVPFAVRISRLHGTVGIFSHSLSMISLALGFASNYARTKFGYEASTICIVLSIFLTAAVLFTKPAKNSSSTQGASTKLVRIDQL